LKEGLHVLVWAIVFLDPVTSGACHALSITTVFSLKRHHTGVHFQNSVENFVVVCLNEVELHEIMLEY